MQQLKGRRGVITGGARGIGADIARGFASQGARVACLDLRDELGQVTAGNIGEDRCFYLRCDVADKAEVDQAFETAVRWLGGLDVLVHAAGLDKPGFAPEDIPEEAWDLVLDVNAKGTFLTNQAACRVMKSAGGGAIINFGSYAGIRGMPDRAAYSAAKGAVFAWTRAVARAWGAYDITVNAIAPTMETEVARRYLESLPAEAREKVDAERQRDTPMAGRLGKVQADLLPLVSLLASDGGRYITGQTLAVDGGRTMVAS